MIGLDTNVLIRYLVRDDQPLYERASRLLRRAVEAGEPVMVSLLTLLEMEWVLRSRYASSKEDIAATISSLLDAAELTFEDEPSIEEAIHLWKGSSTDFADCLINARNRRLGCRTTATFDRKTLQPPDSVRREGLAKVLMDAKVIFPSTPSAPSGTVLRDHSGANAAKMSW